MSKDGIATRKQTMCSATRQGAYFSVRIHRRKTIWVVEKLLDALPPPANAHSVIREDGGAEDISVIVWGSQLCHQRRWSTRAGAPSKT
jgi:hypothetical protein